MGYSRSPGKPPKRSPEKLHREQIFGGGTVFDSFNMKAYKRSSVRSLNDYSYNKAKKRTQAAKRAAPGARYNSYFTALHEDEPRAAARVNLKNYSKRIPKKNSEAGRILDTPAPLKPTQYELEKGKGRAFQPRGKLQSFTPRNPKPEDTRSRLIKSFELFF